MKFDPTKINPEAPTQEGNSKTPKESKPKPKKLELYRHLTKTIGGWVPGDRQAPLPRSFHILRDKTGEHQCLEELEDKVLMHISENKVVSTIAKYIEDTKALIELDLHITDFKNSVTYWTYTAPNFEHKVYPVLQKSQGGYTFHRLPFDFHPQGECPCWDELLARMSNYRAFMAWVGSLFDPSADRQQYVWLYGGGRNGKGSVGRFLARCLASTTTWEQVPDRGDKFWTSGLLGKRLVIFGDCNNFAFPMSGLFKSLTGNDGVRIERKNQQSYTAALDCKFLFLSNEKPQVEAKAADFRRAIFCELSDPTQDFGRDYEERLWAEAPSFLYACWNEYLQSSKESGNIPCSKEELEIIAAVSEDRNEDIFRRNFEIPTHSMLKIDGMQRPNYVEAHVMSRILREDGLKSNHEQSKYHSWLEKTYGVKLDRTRIDNRQFRIFRGIRLKFSL